MNEHETKIQEILKLSLEQDAASLQKAIEQIEKNLAEGDLTQDQQLTLQFARAQNYQWRGEHHKALATLEDIRIFNDDPFSLFCNGWLANLRAISLCALGQTSEACELFSNALNFLEAANADPKALGSVLLEMGKALRANNKNGKAREAWERAIAIFEESGDAEHGARAKANLAQIMLSTDDKEEQKAGLKLMEDSSRVKAEIGDLQGLATNYCNMGLYYWQQERYERALAYLRRDLALSRRVGDLHGVVVSLQNLSELYRVMLQTGSARKCVREAKEIAQQLKNEVLIAKSVAMLSRLEDYTKQISQAGVKIGPLALCICKSRKRYIDCCGRADHEPIDFPAVFSGVSPALDKIIEQAVKAGITPTRMDHILREDETSKQRQSWTRVHVHDGWMELAELPDMSSNFLLAAKTLVKESENEPESISKPLSCVMLSCAALEAFINQVSYFLWELQQFKADVREHNIPYELKDSSYEFQRHTELIKKWEIIGKSLCGPRWPPSGLEWSKFLRLVQLRNELVHFKSLEYESIIPPPKKHHLLDLVAGEVKLRDIPRAWPYRLLTPSFGNWCISVAESLITRFKKEYHKERGYEKNIP
jgi:tetratricopeptide (TPR) repeat protein